MKLSIILPALNEEEHLRPCFENILQSIEAYKIDCEIIAIDDGSTDETLAIMKEYASKDDRNRVIHHVCPHVNVALCKKYYEREPVIEFVG